LKVSKNTKATSLFKRYKIKQSPTLKTELELLSGKNKLQFNKEVIKISEEANQFRKFRKFRKIKKKPRSPLPEKPRSRPFATFDAYKIAKDCLKKVKNTRYTLDNTKNVKGGNLVKKMCQKVKKFLAGFFNFIKPKNKETGKKLWKAIKSSVQKKDTSNGGDPKNQKKRAPRTDEYTMKLEHRIAKLEGVMTRMRNALEMEKDTSNGDGPNEKDEQKQNLEEDTVGEGNDSRRRRLLSEVGEEDYEALWDEFTDMEFNDKERSGACSDAKRVLKQVKVHASGKFEFNCDLDRSRKLCECISSVGGDPNREQHFRAGELNLILFSHEGHAAYEIQESGKALAYGYVNEGRKDRRRRLMQGGTGRTC
jgi:hypothetical protein